MKSKRRINKTLKELRRIIDDPKTDLVTARMAYYAECSIRWAVEDTKDWETPEEDLPEQVKILRREIGVPLT